MKRLKAEYQELAHDFVVSYENAGCSCHHSPPCGFCTHAGHPENLEETPAAWVEMLEPDHEGQEQILLGDGTPALREGCFYFVEASQVNRAKIARQYDGDVLAIEAVLHDQEMILVELVDIERIFGGVA